MRMITLSEEELAAWLHEAKAEHAKYEALMGPDADWPEWYAEYIAKEIGFDVEGPTH